MRQLISLLAVMTLAVTAVWAAPAYGTKMPKAKEAFWGLQHYYVDRHNLDNDWGSLHSHQNFLLLSYGLTEWFVLDLKWSLYSTFRHDAVDGGHVDKYNNGVWGGGYGFRIRLYENGPWKVVGGFQHISIHPKTVKANGEKNSGILDDWQTSTLVSYDLKKFTPYAGLRYSSMDYVHRQAAMRERIKADGARRVGLILGVDVPLGEKVWLNFESDWQDGGAVAGSLNFRF